MVSDAAHNSRTLSLFAHALKACWIICLCWIIVNQTVDALDRSGGSAATYDHHNSDLSQRFAQANELLESGDKSAAIEVLRNLLDDYPGVAELYINLAAAHAGSGALDEARTVLVSGLEQHEQSKALYQNLQAVHSALAAHAFKNALDTSDPEAPMPNVDLTRALTIKGSDVVPDRPQSSEPDTESTAALQQRIARLQAELNTVTERIEQMQQSHLQTMRELQQTLTSQSARLQQAQAAERTALERATAAEQMALTRMNQAIDQLTQSHRRLLAEKNAVIARQADQLVSMQATPVEQPTLITDHSVAPTPKVATKEPVAVSDEHALVQQQLISLVERWADRWSAMDVDGYIAHYADGYSPARSVSHQAWLTQRRDRLRNHDFIDVSVEDFTVEPQGQYMAVTFTQHYRSESIDETIRKRLVFSDDQANWSNAKIVKELRVQG